MINATAVSDGLNRLPAHWLRHFARQSVGVPQDRAAYFGLKGWGRTRFIIRRGRLLYAPTPPNGCVLRRTPILAWALLEALERHPTLPDVSVAFNCEATAQVPERPSAPSAFRLFERKEHVFDSLLSQVATGPPTGTPTARSRKRTKKG